MRLIRRGEVFVAESGYEERALPKAAGMWWHGGGCRDRCAACAAGLGKVWWTPYREKAAALAKYAEPALRAELQGVAQERAIRIEESQAQAAAPEAAAAIPVPAGLAYRPFQAAGILAASRREASLLADEMGLGKTIQALGVWNADPLSHTALVICPASVKINWQREWTRWSTWTCTVGVVTGTKAEGWPKDADVVIVNYDLLKHHRQALRDRTWDLLVVDEAHYCKSADAQRTREAFGWTAPTRGKNAGKESIPPILARKRLALTGTPIVNRPAELYPILSWLAPDRWRPNGFFSFAKRYCNATQGRWGWDFSGASNLPELHTELRARVMIRRRKADVLSELPAKIRQVIEMPRNGAAKAVEAEVAAYSEHQESLEGLRAAVEASRACGDQEAYAAAVAALHEGCGVAFADMARVRHAVAVAKAPALIAYLEDAVESSSKVIFFAHHHDLIDQVAVAFGDRCVTVTGDTPMDKRQEAIDRFQTDERVQLFVGGIRACSEGITLTAASHVVFGELDWTPSRMSQAEDRAHRIGQIESVLVQHLVLEGSLDATMARKLVEKQDVIDRAMDSEISMPVIPDLPPPSTGGTRVDMSRLMPGRFAIPAEAGHLAFYHLQKSERGWWFLMLQAGPSLTRLGAVTPDGLCRDGRVAAILGKIAQDPREAMLRYGRELGVCGHCGLPLTNEESRQRGIGPVCAAKAGW